jgi:repressor LexA
MAKIDQLAQKIKQARVEAALSQKDLATSLKLSDRSISAYEQGRALPPLDTLRSISELTHKSINYFLDDDIAAQENLDLQVKIKKIELELLQIKKALREHGLLD